MGRFTEEHEGISLTVHAERRSLQQLKAGGSKLAQRILTELAEGARYSHELARALKVHEQKIYYHMRKLERAGLVVREREQEINGGNAKYYALAAPAFTAVVGAMAEAASGNEKMSWLAPFINEGKAAFTIVVGSPEGHGPHMARARDANYAIDLACWLGSFLEERPRSVMRLDTELKRGERKGNLIIIGGPIVNGLARELDGKLAVTYDEERRCFKYNGKTYAGEETGIIVKGKNLWDAKGEVLWIAGRRAAGTKAAILALLKHADKITGDVHIVEGIDKDGDGDVDDAKVVV